MKKLMNNKYVAGGFIFAILQWMAYMALAGIDFQDCEHVRCKAAVLRDGMTMLTGTLGQIPAGILLPIAGFGLSYVAYKRAERASAHVLAKA